MKWLLVSTNRSPYVAGTNHPHNAGWNVGDVFARMGTEEIVREVDPSAIIAHVNMDHPESHQRPQWFDRAIFAGRPMFWKGCETHPLWHDLLNGWLCREPRKVLALGVGDVFPIGTPDDAIRPLVEKAERKVWRLTVRRRGLGDFGACPATWLLLGRDELPARNLCNLMRGGGHYPEFDPARAAAVELRLKEWAAAMIGSGFEFIAHTLEERRLAAALGWEGKKIHFHSSPHAYLSTYASASEYVGFRVHGALVLAGRNASATVIASDTRALAAQHVGLVVDSEPRGSVQQWPVMIAKRIEMITEERARALQLMKEFAQ